MKNITPDFLDNDETLPPLPGINKNRIVLDFTECVKKYDINSLEKSEKCKLVDAIHKYSQISWHESFVTHKHGLGLEEIKRKGLKVAIPSHIKKECRFYALRFDSKKPIVGYQDNDKFKVIWIDRNFKVYNHGS